MRRRSHSPPRWWLWLGLWTVVGLAIRLITVYRDPNKIAGGDAYFYHYGANLLVSGVAPGGADARVIKYDFVRPNAQSTTLEAVRLGQVWSGKGSPPILGGD